MPQDNRTIRPQGARRVEGPDVQDRLRALWAEDARSAQDKIDRLAKTGGRGSTNDQVNATMRQKTEALIVKTRARRQCDSCYRLTDPADLIRCGGGWVICGDPKCAERAKGWRFKP
jgi:hypothetical protein